MRHSSVLQITPGVPHLALFAAIIALLMACGSPMAAPAGTARTAHTTAAGIPTSIQRPLSAHGVVQELRAAGLPIGEATVWTADTDPDKLLGRPGHYIDKATFHDTRLSSVGGTVEIFRTEADLEARRETLEAVGHSSPPTPYLFSSGWVLLRLPAELTPDQAAAYQRALAEALRAPVSGNAEQPPARVTTPAFVAGAAGPIPARSATPPTVAPGTAIQTQTLVDTGSWQLLVGRAGDQVAAAVTYDARDQQGLLAYAAAVRELGPGVFATQPSVPALITFRRPLVLDRFTELMGGSGAAVRTYRLRTVQADGQRGIVQGVPRPDGASADPGQPRTKDGGAIPITGVIDAEVTLDRAAYEALARNTAEVFLVDVMRAVASRELAVRGVHEVPVDRITLQAPYWYLEEFGLITP